MKKILFVILLSISFSSAFSHHIKGGFFTYQYLGPGIINPTYLRYKITLKIYMTCDHLELGQLDSSIFLTIFNGDGSVELDNPEVNLVTPIDTLGKTTVSPCISGDQPLCYYQIATYVLDNYEVPVTPDGYIISFQRCCRIDDMKNVLNSAAVGTTYSIKIPGTSSPIIDANKNSSPVFAINDTVLVCSESYFSFSFRAVDPNGDSLVYSLCNAYPGGNPSESSPNPASNPPYGSVPYVPPYSGSQQMGTGVTIDPISGIISGIAPALLASDVTGEFVVTVCVQEYRNGVYFADSRKELHIRVQHCTPLKALLKFPSTTCDGFTQKFSNNVANPSGTIFSWDFGDPSTGILNTSTDSTPVHTFSGAGTYQVKLKVTSGGGLCNDSSTSSLNVFPGFFPGFKTLAPLCIGVPVHFIDTSKTNYGTITGWQWDFGDNTTSADISNQQNPIYTYANPGTYHVQFEVANTKGCMDTLHTNVIILSNPALTVTPHDTTYCILDTLQLTATGNGNFSWSPLTNIIGTNSSVSSVYPVSVTKYFVTLNNAGCISKDSVIVRPKNSVAPSISSINQICEEDTLILTGSSTISPVSWLWTPGNSVLFPTQQSTKAFPSATTTYTLTTTWGKHCTASSSKTINVIPLATPVIAPVNSICFTEGSAQLNASGGNSYQWSPATSLSNPNISNPIATPVATTQYTVLVGVAACPKKRSATIIVPVLALPSLSLTDDTLICSIDTLQLTVTGNGNISWSPNYNINNLASHTPLVSPDVPTEYYARLTDASGCYSDDSVFVDVRTFITVNAGNDTTICQSDSIQLHPVSEALSYSWTPVNYLSDPSSKYPIAAPVNTITYTITANLGKCQAHDNITVHVAPYPHADAGKDTSLCLGFSTQLHGSGGSIYLWSPAVFLSNTTIPNPLVVNPLSTILYTLTVKDTLGCPKSSSDAVRVIIAPDPIVDAGPRDTSIVDGEPLQLNGTGADTYSWVPATWLNDPNIADPISLPQGNIQYILYGETKAGCKGNDTISIKVYNVDPDLYVPSAFTPNGDGLNDNFRPILLGMKQLSYFRVYNRWGQLVFATSVIGNGWDGTFKGSPQDSGNYVWIAEGIDYKGRITKKKGNVVLIR